MTTEVMPKPDTGVHRRPGSVNWPWRITAPDDLRRQYRTKWAYRASLEKADLREANHKAAGLRARWPGSQQVREAHRARLRDPGAHPLQVVLAGPTFGDGGMNGTMLVLRAADIEAVRAFVAEDPYVLHGVCASVEVRPWFCGLGPLADIERENR